MQPPQFDPNKTMIGGPGQVPDLQRTQAVNVSATVGPSITATVFPGRTASMANGPAREQFLIEIEARRDPGLPGIASGSQRTPLNLCLVLDRSGSMEGPPLEYAKQACQYVVDLLGPNDILSIVTFEEVVNVLMPPQRVSAKDPIKAGIAAITAGNTTDLYGGIAQGLNQVVQSNEPGRATRLVILSDGDPTTGIKDFASLTAFAGEVKAKGVTATFLGFGPDYNEELLATMARKAGGNYAYIPRPELIPEVFRLEVDKMMAAAATNLTLNLDMARWVNLRGGTGITTPPTGDKLTIPLADLEQGAVIQQLLDFEFPNHPLGHYRIASASLQYDDAGTGKVQTIPIDLVIEFTADASRYSAPVDPRVANAAELSFASRAVEKTIMGMKSGQITSQMAIAELQKTQAMMLKDGRVQDAQEVTMALRALSTGDMDTAQKTLMGTMVNLDQGKKTT